MINWIYENTEVAELPENVFGFIYKLTMESGKHYIGMKQCFNMSTLPALKNGTIREGAKRVGKNKNGKRVYFDVIYKESKWREYESSSKEVENETIVKKEILEYAPTKRSLSYLEVKQLFMNNVLEDENYLNMNISGRWFKNRLL